MGATARPIILCVDDEQRLIENFVVLLRKEYDVRTANSGPAALEMLRDMKDVALVLSDFRMPKMDGAAFLHEVMQRAPLATRILLTGEAGVEGAKDAVNKGQIFRFLTKPCPIDQLKIALAEGVSQHNLARAERTMMKETLLECIAALMEILSVTNPVAFGRAQRIKKLAADLALRLDCTDFWQLEAAALLSQIGYYAVSPELAEKIYYGRPLSGAEQDRAAAVPRNAQQLLEHVPRLEPVLQVLAALDWTDEQLARQHGSTTGLSARILGAALEYDAGFVRGLASKDILLTLRSREARFGAKVLEALAANISEIVERQQEVVIPLRDAAPGMRLCEEIRTSRGALLVPIGFEISARLIERISQVAPEALDRRIRLTRSQ